MGKAVVFFLFLLSTTLPTFCLSETAHDLRARIRIDGDVGDFLADEWILDAVTTFPERPRDSRWGTDNDVRRVALTWDDFNLYVAVPAVTATSTLMLFIDTMCGGLDDLNVPGELRRNVEFGGFTANFVMTVSRAAPEPRSHYVDCNSPLARYDPGLLSGVYVQAGVDSGALETAIPWELLGAFVRGDAGTEAPEPGQTVDVLAVISAGPGSGVGDAAPDPSVILENDSTRLAVLNNYMRVPVDADGDGFLDVGVSPRAVASSAISAAQDSRQALPLRVLVEKKIFAPDNGEVFRFQARLDPPDYGLPVFLTARVYNAAGHLLRSLFADEPRDLSGGSPAWEEWNGRDSQGNIVPGGVYVLAVSGGAAPGVRTKTVKASFAVIR